MPTLIGLIKVNDNVVIINSDGVERKGKVSQLYSFRGMDRIEMEEVITKGRVIRFKTIKHYEKMGIFGKRRDGHQVNVFKKTIKEYPNARIVHIRGMMHLAKISMLPFRIKDLPFGRFRTLYHRVKKWTAGRYVLSQF